MVEDFGVNFEEALLRQALNPPPAFEREVFPLTILRLGKNPKQIVGIDLTDQN
jgi:hypothetical protein